MGPGDTLVGMATDKDTARAGFEESLKNAVKALTDALVVALANAQSDADRKRATDEYRDALKVHKEGRESARKILDEVFP
jgi:vacuolar-type H+-ATPase subunit E/Vma4